MKNEQIEWVSIDDLIRMLQEEKERLDGDGTIPVCLNGISTIWLVPKPYYYDGGYYAVDAEDKTNVKHSRTGQGVTPGFHDTCVDLWALNDDHDMKVNGRPVKEIDPKTWAFYDKLEQEERAIFGGQVVQYRLLEEKNEEWGCYPFEAYLDSGETALGPCMKDAKETLIEVYQRDQGCSTQD
jgi:hypothetical protein